jgi:hypothetical protein
MLFCSERAIIIGYHNLVPKVSLPPDPSEISKATILASVPEGVYKNTTRRK